MIKDAVINKKIDSLNVSKLNISRWKNIVEIANK